MKVNRSSFYKWRRRIKSKDSKAKKRMDDISLFVQYHDRFPTHGYRWLNAKIRLDTGCCYSDNYAYRCCHYAGIRSTSKRFRYRYRDSSNTGSDTRKTFPNLLTADLDISGPLQVVVSDMTAFKWKGTYYELTLYMDLFNNEILSHRLSSRKGDRMTYIDGLKDLIDIKKEYPHLEMILHSDQGSVYSSKAFNDLLPLHNITRSMSKVATPTDNASMESINGWLKEEFFEDFKLNDIINIQDALNDYIHFFNYERPAYSLNYMTPIQFKEMFKSV